MEIYIKPHKSILHNPDFFFGISQFTTVLWLMAYLVYFKFSSSLFEAFLKRITIEREFSGSIRSFKKPANIVNVVNINLLVYF